MSKPTKREYQKMMIKSILAPLSHMQGLIGNISDDYETFYSVPKGLSPELCMIAVLGSITSDENAELMNTASSSGGEPDRDWTKTWFMRDFAGNDEERGSNVDAAIQQGRKQAKEAFEAYERGDKAAFNTLLKNGSKQIIDKYFDSPIGSSANWNNASAYMSLLKDSFGNAEFEKIMGVDDALKHKLDERYAFDKISSDIVEMDEELESLNPEQQERKAELLQELVSLKKIQVEYNEYFTKAESLIVGDLYDAYADAENNVNPLAVLATEKGSKLYDEMRQFYIDTHPSEVVALCQSEDGLKQVKDAYKQVLIKLPRYEEELKKLPSKINSGFGNYGHVEVSLPKIVTDQKRESLNTKWEAKYDEYKEQFLAIKKEIIENRKHYNEKVESIATDFGMSKPFIYDLDEGPRSRKTLQLKVEGRRSFYVIDEDFQTIVKVQSEDGKNFKAEKVDDLFANPFYTEETMIAASYQNELATALKSIKQNTDLSYITLNHQKDVFKEQDLPLMEQYIQIDNECKDWFKSVTIDKITTLTENVNALSDKLKESLQKEDSEHVKALQTAVDAIKEALKRGDENHKGFKAVQEQKLQIMHKRKSLSIPFTERKPVLDSYIENEKAEYEKLDEISSISGQKSVTNRETGVMLNLATYIDGIKQSLSTNPKDLEQYSSFIEASKLLTDKTADLYTRDSDGNFKDMTKDDYDSLMSMYENVLIEGKKLKVLGDDPASDRTALYMVNKIVNLAEKDVSVLENINPENQMSLPGVIENAGKRQETDKQFLNMDADRLVQWSNRIDESQRKIFGNGSDEFRNLKTSLDAYVDAIRSMSDTLDFKEQQKIQAKMEAVQDCAKDYLKIKNAKKLSAKTRERVEIASEIADFFDKKLATYKQISHSQDELSIEDMNAKLKAEAIKLAGANQKSADSAMQNPNPQAQNTQNLTDYKTLEDAASKIMLNENESSEIRRMMSLGTEAFTRADMIAKGEIDSKASPSINQYEKEVISVCETIIKGRESGDKIAVQMEQNIEKLGVEKFISDYSQALKKHEAGKQIGAAENTLERNIGK